MTDIKGRDRKNHRAGVSRNINAQSVFDTYAHRPVLRSGYCASIMSFYDEEAAVSGQDVAVVTTGEPITNATIPHTPPPHATTG